jgi:hypothetical protein
VAAFAAELFFLRSFGHSMTIAEKDRSTAQQRAQGSLGEQMPIRPDADTLAAAQQNAKDLQTVLDTVKAPFLNTPVKITDAPGSGPELLVDIQSYVSDLQAKAKDKDVVLPDPDYTFGMAMYVGRGVSAPPADKITAVYTQMKVLQYILDHLMDDAKLPNQPMKLVSVLREDVTAVKHTGFVAAATAETDDEKTEIFGIDPAVTARVPGFIDTLAFQIKFISYTESLRLLLQDLKNFDLPLVVRSVEVEPATEDRAGVAPATGKKNVSEAAKPVVAENLSQFTLVIEYIQLPTPPAPADAAGIAAPAGTVAPAGTAAGG